MFQVLDYAQYAQVVNSPRRSDPTLASFYRQGAHLLIARWASKLSSHQLSILFFLFDRTFYHSKLSETVVFDQFMHGMVSGSRDEKLFGGLKISEMTLTKQLKELCEMDYIHIRACVAKGKKAETKPRIYAINCKMLFNLDIADEENPMILRVPKAKKQVESEENEATSRLKAPRKVVEKPPLNLGDIYSNNIRNKLRNRIDKSIHLAAPAACDDPLDKAKKIQSMIEEQKKKRALRAEAKIDQMRSGLLKPSALKRADMQTLIDNAMQRYYPTLPRMSVSDKPLSVLKKRLATAKLDNLPEFIDWAIGYWESTAHSQQRSYNRQLKEGSTKTYAPLPKAPDFTQLCYRFPYFLACYRSYLVERGAGFATTEKDKDKQKIEKLQRALAHATAEKQKLQTIAKTARARRKEEQTEETTRRITRTIKRPVISDDDLFADESLPTWEEVQAKHKGTK